MCRLLLEGDRDSWLGLVSVRIDLDSAERLCLAVVGSLKAVGWVAAWVEVVGWLDRMKMIVRMEVDLALDLIRTEEHTTLSAPA